MQGLPHSVQKRSSRVLAELETGSGAVLEIEQNVKNGHGRQRNDRIVAEPVSAHRGPGTLSSRVRGELEAFFVAVTLFEEKDVRVLRWGDAAAAEALIDRASRPA